MATVHEPSQLRWFFWERGGIQKWVALGPPFVSCWASSPARILKLQKHINRYFLLVQFDVALQISVAETQEYLLFLPQHNPGSKSFSESLQQLEKHHRVGCQGTILVWSNEVMNFVSEIFAWASLRHWYFYLVEALFFSFELAQI